MKRVECSTAEEALKEIGAGNIPVIRGDLYLEVSVSCTIQCNGGKPRIVAWGSSQPHVEALGSSQPHVEAWGSSQPHVVAWESSQPHVVAWESSQPHVVAWESSQPHVVAWESSQPHVEAWESSQPHVEAQGSCQLSVKGRVKVKANKLVAVLAMGALPIVEGGGFVNRVDNKTPAEWCDYYGIPVGEDGTVVLFKALDRNFCSPRGTCYAPGESPKSDKWDGGEVECGSGLHFSPSPGHARGFYPEALKYAACRVRLDEIAVHPDGDYPAKVKAPRALECWEVNLKGERIEPPPAVKEAS